MSNKPRTLSSETRQVAALPWRHGPAGVEIMMITSRETRRWVIPKGNRMAGKTDAEAGDGEQGPQDDDAKGKKEPKEADPDKLKKAIIQVKHDDRPARLILNRRPPAEGWAWLKYEDDGQEFEADLGTVQLVALLEG